MQRVRFALFSVLPSSEVTSLVSLQYNEELISETTAWHHTFGFFCLLCPVSMTGSELFSVHKPL